MQAHRLAIRQRFDDRPRLLGLRLPVQNDPQAFLQQLGQGGLASGERVDVEQTVHGVDAKLVRQIVDVCHQG